ncbi:MAG: hypothetical protein LBT04_05345 [Prevotellaceae bacterium]|jgi:hypothetical protein|nr:hypothetical protein [Prevotellaceae bacterium]
MKTTKVLFFTLLIAVMATMPQGAMSQVTIGADQPPQSFSVLELISNSTRGLRLPQLKENQRNALQTQIEGSAAATKDLARGLTIYNSTRNCVQYWNGSDWIDAGICGVVIPSVDFPKTPGCPGSDPKPVTWMTYNLGAATSATIGTTTYDLTTPKGQMKWLADKAANGGGVDFTDATVYGDLYQWGRQTDGHEKRNSTVSSVYAYQLGNDVYSNGDGTGQIINSTLKDQFIKNNTHPWDWQKVASSFSDFWGNGRVIYSYPTKDISSGVITYGTTEPSSGTPGVDFTYIDDGGNPYTSVISPNPAATRYYQQPKRTDYDPCPAGWRVPTQDEWETLGDYCDPSTADGYFYTSSNNNSVVTTVGAGTATVPTRNPNLVWVTVANGLPDASSWSAATSSLKVGGYALYDKTEWDNADADYNANGTKPLYDVAAPVPLLFLPAAGGRRDENGAFLGVGSFGSYWSSTVNLEISYYLYFDTTSIYPRESGQRASGLSVRCVAD